MAVTDGQLDLFSQPTKRKRAVARATDPHTSWAAAHGISDLRPRQAAVLRCLVEMGGDGTDEEIEQAYFAGLDRWAWPMQSSSGLRTRRKELVDLGAVKDSGTTRTTRAGNKTIVWRAAPRKGS